MMVYDCFTFSDELDLLELRMRHLWDLVDFFVVCESPYTFAGKNKPLHLANNMARFTWAQSKLRPLVCDDMVRDAKPQERWVNEVRQRNFLANGLGDAQPGDTVLLGDADEIPAQDAIQLVKEQAGKSFVMLMTGHCYFLDRRLKDFTWHGTCAVPFKNGDAIVGRPGRTMQDIRNERTSGRFEPLVDAGWHMSYTGGVEAIQQKLAGFSHAEFDTPEFHDPVRIVRDMMEDRVFLDGIPLVQVEDYELPPVIRRARASHGHLFHPLDKRAVPKLYDCFMFWKEVELLQMRLRHMYDTVDKFVIVEAPFTFTGKPKPLYFWDNRGQFEWAMDKIQHVLVDFEPRTNEPWWNESAQRNSIMRGLGEARPNDIVLISDVDELPRPETLKEAITMVGQRCEPFTLTLDKCYYRLNNFMTGHEPGTEPHPPWNMFVVCQKQHTTKRGPQELRDAHNSMPTLTNGGWHFSFMGEADLLREKVEAFSHTEYNTPAIIAGLEDKITGLRSDVFDRGYTFEVREPQSGTLPDCVLQNLDYYRTIGLIAE
ncbi:MAG: hypothetical protein JSS66_07535 [Armatimonadetes bacterium]|nr:hypothetical protein [Armatimonadota bacterium]